MSSKKTEAPISKPVFFGMVAYTLLWAALLPFAIIYLFIRSIKDPRYRRFIPERFGFYKTSAEKTIWLHANSLGEVRSATSILQRLMENGETVVVTNMTPAGRSITQSLFADQIKAKQLLLVYVPIEFKWIYKRFFKTYNPEYGLVMEAEIWPKMIMSSKQAAVPLFLCNAQYSLQKKRKAKGRFLANICSKYAGIFAKSDLQAERFRNIGCTNICVCGETRFDQNVPEHLINASLALKTKAGFRDRPILTIASVDAGEEKYYTQLIDRLFEKAAANDNPLPLIIYVPRAKEQFEPSYNLFKVKYQTFKRTDILDEALNFNLDTGFQADIIIGNSFGEMFFYQHLASAVLVGGGFLAAGAHNIIEPIMMLKPVFVGPYTWSIEYPSQEAIAANILVKEETALVLAEKTYARLYLLKTQDNIEHRCREFLVQNSGASAKIIANTPGLLKTANAKLIKS